MTPSRAIGIAARGTGMRTTFEPRRSATWRSTSGIEVESVTHALRSPGDSITATAVSPGAYDSRSIVMVTGFVPYQPAQAPATHTS